MTIEEKLQECVEVLQSIADGLPDCPTCPQLVRDMAARAAALEVDHRPKAYPFK